MNCRIGEPPNCRIWPRATLALVVLLAAGVSNSQESRKTQEVGFYESVYRNCEHAYAVKLPPRVIAHAGDPAPAQHGFLISPSDPGTRKNIPLDSPRLIDVYDDFDSTELGTPRAYFDQYDKEAPDGVTPIVRSIRETRFHGMSALYVRLSKAGPDHHDETEQIIAYQDNVKNLGPIFYILFLRSTEKDFAKDHALFVKIQQGFRAYRERHGACPELNHGH